MITPLRFRNRAVLPGSVEGGGHVRHARGQRRAAVRDRLRAGSGLLLVVLSLLDLLLLLLFGDRQRGRQLLAPRRGRAHRRLRRSLLTLGTGRLHPAGATVRRVRPTVLASDPFPGSAG